MNPLLAKVKLPGRVFQLPSKGVFYAEEGGVLADSVHEGEIQVKPMSALAEMKLKSADLLMSGKILRELCEECVPEIINPEKLVSQDVDALFAFLRVVTYGATLRVMSMHDCDKAKSHEYEVNVEALIGQPNNKIIEHADTIYRVPLTNGQIVHTRPNTYAAALKVIYIRQELNRQERDGGKADEKLVEKAAMLDLMSVIRAVEDDGQKIDDEEMIDEWLRAISKPILNELLAGVGKTTKWGFDFTAKLKCKDCGATYDHELDLDPVSFFFG
jgi:hypothetical protein